MTPQGGTATLRCRRRGDTLGVGCVALGMAGAAGLYHRGSSAANTLALLRRAHERGLRHVDTAPHYGRGQSELDIGAALAADAALRRDLVLGTKVGRRVEPAAAVDAADRRVEGGDRGFSEERSAGRVCVADYTACGIAASAAASAERLGAALGPAAAGGAAVAELRVHDAEEEWRLEELLSAGGIGALRELKAAGVARVGAGLNNAAYARRLLAAAPGALDHVLLAGCFNLLDQSGAAMLCEAAAAGVGVFAAGVFCAGLLWGGAHYRYEAAAADVLARRDALAALCAAHGVALPWLAFWFATRPVAVERVLIGPSTPQELDACLDVVLAPPPAGLDRLLAAGASAGLLPEWVLDDEPAVLTAL